MQNLERLPSDLPPPLDDGGSAHLPGLALPHCRLRSTQGGWVDAAAIPGRVVIYCYPKTGRPGQALPQGWDEIPGARGCTPQTCAFRDHHAELGELQTQVFGLSVQSSDYQQEAAQRLHLPFALLSDADYEFTDALRLPTFEVDGKRLNKRLTLIARNGVIEHCFYPVFPPDQNSEQVLAWLRQHP